MEKLITKAKVGDLHKRRQIISSLQTLAAANKLVDEIAPKLKNRNSGFLRIKKSVTRRGDNAQLSIIEFVDNLKEVSKVEAVPKEKEEAKS